MLLISLETLFGNCWRKIDILHDWNRAKVKNIIKLICIDYKNKFRHHQAANVESLYISSTYECFWRAKLSVHLVSSLDPQKKRERYGYRASPTTSITAMFGVDMCKVQGHREDFTSCRSETNWKLTCRNTWPYPRRRWRATSRWRSTWGPSCYPGRTLGRERGGTRDTWAGVSGA